MIVDNLPVLAVIVPLLAALAAAVLGKGGRAWWIAMGASLASFAACAALLLAVRGAPGGVVSYPLGSWPAPFGIEYRVDALNAFVLVLVSGVASVVTLHARWSAPPEIGGDRLHLFYAVWLLCLTGLLGITVTGDAFNVYVLLEITSLASYTLVALGKGRDRRALTASLHYLVMGTLGASFILLGIGYLYMVTGTLNMEDMARRLGDLFASWENGGPQEHRRTVVTGFVFLLAGLGLKLALFPLHVWLPEAYARAPSPVAALLASTATKVGAYVALRFLYAVVGRGFSFGGGVPTAEVLVACGVLAILGGSLLAVRQEDLRRMLAYSSVAQVGYIALGIALVNEDGLTGSVVHLFNHALVKGGLFLSLATVAYRTGATDLESIRGLGRRMPWTLAAFTVGGLSLVGVPLTAGFVSKWYLVTGAIRGHRPLLAAVVLAGSFLALVYVWRVVEAAYFRDPAPGSEAVREAPFPLVACAWLLAGAGVWFGVDAGFTAGAAGDAARALLARAP